MAAPTTESTSSEKMFRLLKIVAEQAAEGIIIVDAAGIIRFANHASVRAHGLNLRTDLLGKNISVLHTPRQMSESVMSFIQGARRLGHFSGPLDHVRSDGTIFQTDTKMTVVRGDDGQSIGLIIFHTDTTEREEAKAALAAAREELRKLGASDGSTAAQPTSPEAPSGYSRTQEDLCDEEEVSLPTRQSTQNANRPAADDNDGEGLDPYRQARKTLPGPLDTDRLEALADLLKRLS
jgi:PAS domain S-box-containing protein